jgi:hypothetical protein
MLKRLCLLLPALLCASVVASSAASVRVKVNGTPMRADASATSAVVMELKAGALLELVDANRDWYKVRDPQSKKEGFVAVASAELLPGPAVPAGGQKPPAGQPAPGQKPATGEPGAKPLGPPKKGEWVDTGYLSFGGLFEGGVSGLTQTQTWPSFAETASVSIDYPGKSAAGVDFGGGFRVWRNLAAGLSLTYVSRSTATSVSGSLPNPLYLNRPVSLSGGFDARNAELGLHLQLGWVVPMPPRIQVVIFGGPTIFSVKQTIVEAQGIGLSSAYPFESGSISSATTTEASKTGIGFGGGVDVAYYFTRTVGVGGLVRVTRGSVSFPISGQPSADVKAGGFQASVGLRVRIPSARSPKPAPKPPAKKPAPPAPAPRK